MTTSDDEPIYAEQPGGDPAATTHAEPLGDDFADGGEDYAAIEPVAPAGGGRRVLLGILAAVLVAIAGVAAWALIYAQAEREYVGVAVVIGLAVGWVLRVVSGRTDLWLRFVAVLITAVSCVAGTVTGEVAYTAKVYRADFWQLLGDIAPDWFEVMRRRPALSFAIFLAGLVLAYLSASPQKEKTKKGAVATAPADEAWGPDDEIDLPPADDEDDEDDGQDPPRLPG